MKRLQNEFRGSVRKMGFLAVAGLLAAAANLMLPKSGVAQESGTISVLKNGRWETHYLTEGQWIQKTYKANIPLVGPSKIWSSEWKTPGAISSDDFWNPPVCKTHAGPLFLQTEVCTKPVPVIGEKVPNTFTIGGPSVRPPRTDYPPDYIGRPPGSNPSNIPATPSPKFSPPSDSSNPNLDWNKIYNPPKELFQKDSGAGQTGSGPTAPGGHITYDDSVPKVNQTQAKPVQLQSLPKRVPGTQSSSASIRF